MNKLVIGKRYKYKGKSYVFRGRYSRFCCIEEGLYLDENNRIKIVEKKEPNDLLQELMSNKGNVEGISRKQPLKNIEMTTPPVADKRISLSESLRFNINPNDDIMVRRVKEEVNKREIKANSIDYNLIYGLRIRNTMKFETFQKWAVILGMTIKIDLV